MLYSNLVFSAQLDEPRIKKTWIFLLRFYTHTFFRSQATQQSTKTIINYIVKGEGLRGFSSLAMASTRLSWTVKVKVLYINKTDLITLITKTLTGHHKVAQINGECRCKLKTKQRDLGDCKTTDRLTSTKIALWVDFKMEFKSSFELRFWSTIDKSDQKFVLWLWRSGRWSAPEEELWLSRVVHICHVPLANVNTDRSASVATDEQFTMLAKRSNRVWL